MKRFQSLSLFFFLAAALTILSLTVTAADVLTAGQTEHSTAGEADGQMHVPMDIFTETFNPWDVDTPESFTVNSASFGRQKQKWGDEILYVLAMTAGGDMSSAVSFMADAAGLDDIQKQDRVQEYLSGGFCQFQSTDGAVITIRKTNPDDDRYQYIDGCLIEIMYVVDTADSGKYISFIQDNYNLHALSALEDIIDIKPIWDEFDFSVNLHKREVNVSNAYSVSDFDSVQRDINALQTIEWRDAEHGSLGWSYGEIKLKCEFDSEGGGVWMTETSSEFDAPLSAYVEADVSLKKLKFGFDPEGLCGVFEEREPHYSSVAISRPEWGDFDWNMEFMDEVNGGQLRITFHASDNHYHISADKNGEIAAFDYLPEKDEYSGDYPDLDTVQRMFNEMFGTTGKEFYEKPLAYFHEYLKIRFDLTFDVLYQLPIQ